jgi:small-conductance mechanosensitive channel
MNIYAVSMMLVYYIVANYLLEYINPQFIEHHYLDLLEKRAFIFLWLLGAFNMAFYFGVGFRLIVGVILLYSINATFSQIIVIHSNFGFAETPIFSAYALSRPLFMIATVGALIFYKDT